MSPYEYNEGYNAATMYGKRITDNPYKVGTKEHDDWLNGYTDADPWALHETNKGYN